MVSGRRHLEGVLEAHYEQPEVYVSGAAGVLNGTCQWMYVYGGVITLSTDDGRLQNETIYGDVKAIAEDGKPLLVVPSFHTNLFFSELHGSFQLPASWEASSGNLQVAFGPQSNACNTDCPVPDEPSTGYGRCGYDGMIQSHFFTTINGKLCAPSETVAFWKWR